MLIEKYKNKAISRDVILVGILWVVLLVSLSVIIVNNETAKFNAEKGSSISFHSEELSNETVAVFEDSTFEAKNQRIIRQTDR